MELDRRNIQQHCNTTSGLAQGGAVPSGKGCTELSFYRPLESLLSTPPAAKTPLRNMYPMNSLFFFKTILTMSLCFMLCSYSNTKKHTLPDPEIKDGIAKLSGKITNFDQIGGNRDNRMLILRVPHLVTAEVYVATTAVNEDGAFTFEVPMQCNFAITYLRPEKTYDGFYVCLTSGKETKLDIIYDRQDKFKITNQTDSLGLTATDLINLEMAYDKISNARPPGMTGYAKTPNEFLKRTRNIVDYQLEKIAKIDALSEISKNWVANCIKLFMLDWIYFDYRKSMQVGYKNAGNEDVENYHPPEPDKNFYAFLKDYDLNNPQYLYHSQYYVVLQKVLLNETLNIPPIGDTPIAQWMKEVKKILSKLVGFNKGLFYDLLAANSYARQFNNELRPLTDQQKENITNYFKEDVAKMLLRKNDEIIRLAAQKDPLVVNETPAVPTPQLMDAIISKYKGKVVIVDFWATWCGPCLMAMEEYRTVKSKLQGKNVVTVYLTNQTSPPKAWEEKIKGIGGEHYYIEKFDDWKHLMDIFSFQYIPSYVIFDIQGEVRHKFTTYPGNDQMQAMIEELLP